MSADSLKKLHTALVDTRVGDQEAEKDAYTPVIRALFTEMVALKKNHHAELHASLSKLGEKPTKPARLVHSPQDGY